MGLSVSEMEWRLIQGMGLIFLLAQEFLELLKIPEAVNVLALYGASDLLHNCGNYIQVPLATLLLIAKAPSNIMRLLLNHGLDLNKKDVQGRQSLFYLLKLPGAKEAYGNIFFQHWTPDLNITDNFGKNCLTYFLEKNIDPLNCPNIQAKVSHMRGPNVMTIQTIEGIKNIDLMRRPVVELISGNGCKFYGLLLVYNSGTVILPIKQGIGQGLELVWKQPHSGNDSGGLSKWKIVLDVGSLLTGHLVYGNGNNVQLTTSNREYFQGKILVAEIEKEVLKTCILIPFNRLYIPHTDQPTDQFKKCKINQGEHEGKTAVMMSLTATPKRLLLLTEGPEGQNFFRPTFVSLTQDQYEFVHLDGQPSSYVIHWEIVDRSLKFLQGLMHLTRMNV